MSVKNNKKPGPKTNWKMTDAIVGKLEYAFSIDATISEGCSYAGISRDTYYEWIKNNKELSDRFEQLRLKPIFEARITLIKGIKNNPELALKYLERKRRSEFNPQYIKEVREEDGKMSPEHSARVISILKSLEKVGLN